MKKTNPRFTSHQVKVSVVDGWVVCDPPVQTILRNTIATITWRPKRCGEFLFLTFAWDKKNGFLSQDPIIHDQCVIAAVNNTQANNDKEWVYELKVQVGDRVYETRRARDKLRATGGDGRPKIHTL